MQTGEGAFGFVVHASEGYVIGILPELTHEEQETDIAHELYHIILQEQGYAYQFHIPEGASHWLSVMGPTITSCVDDAIVDDKTSSLGFHPEVLNRRGYERMQLPPDVQQLLQDPIYMDGTALVIACSFARKGVGNQGLNRWALVSAEAAKRGEALRNKIGSFTCDGAAACNEKKKQIRDILGYPILICNPLAGKWE